MLSKQQSISTNTPSNTELPLSQTDPEAAKRHSAAHKLELFETVKGIQEGYLPDNDQLNSLLERLINNRVIRSREHRMSQDGKKLLNDFRALMETLKKAIQVKNKDQLFQSFVHQLHCMDMPISKKQLTKPVDESEKNIVKQEGNTGSQALYNIGKLILLDNEFRAVLGELIDIGQNIFGSLTEQVGEDLKGTGDIMKDSMNGKEKVDDIVLGNQDVNEPHLINENATDPLHAGILNTEDSVHPDILPTHPDRMTQQINEKLSGSNLSQFQSNPISLESLNKMYQYKNTIQSQAQEHTNTAMQHLKSRKQHVNQTIKENFDKERQTELLDRLQNALTQVQQHPDYQEAIITLIDLVKTWSGRLGHASENIKKSQDDAEQASYRYRAEMKLKTLIEGWAQGRSIDPILEGVQTVMSDAKNDPDLRQYYDTAIKYVQCLLIDPRYVNSKSSREDGKQLIDAGRQLMKGKYDENYQYLSNHVREFMHLLAEDDIAQEINNRLTQIHQDLWMDSEGNPAFKPHLLNDMRKTLLPAFLDEIKFIPVPRIVISDDQFDVVVENVIISGETLIPNVFDIKVESFSSFNLKSDQDTISNHQSLQIHMSEIQADINDVIFSYSKKTGFPKIKDHGVASLAVDKKGISIVARIQSTDNPAKTFKVTHCKCHVDHMKVKVNESKYDIVYKAVLPLVMGTVRKHIARTIETKLIESLNTLDQKVTTSLVNMNQKLENKAYDALPENEKADPNVQPEKLSQARPRPGLFSTLVTFMNRNIQTKTEKRKTEKKTPIESSAASMKTDRYHALHDTTSSTANSSFLQPPVSSQLKNHPDIDSTLASSTLSDEYTDLSQNISSNSATIDSNLATSGDPSYSQQNSNDQIDITKLPHPSASSYNIKNIIPEPSATGTHNTPLSDGNTITQESKAVHSKDTLNKPLPDNTNDLKSSFSQPVPKHDHDSNKDPVNSNGIDNQHFKLAMELGEAQNPRQQSGGKAERAHYL